MGNMSSKNKERKERKNRESEMKIWMKSKIDKHSQDLLDGETFMIIAPSEDLCMTRKDVDKIPGRGYYWFEDGEEPCCVSRVVSIENDGQREFTIMALQKDACVQVGKIYAYIGNYKLTAYKPFTKSTKFIT